MGVTAENEELCEFLLWPTLSVAADPQKAS